MSADFAAVQESGHCDHARRFRHRIFVVEPVADVPFDKIKVDKSFTQNLTKRTECAAIIAATLTLARSLDIETTAEGVETVDQYRLLRLAGVTSLQGFLFQAPCLPSKIDFRSAYSVPEVENAA